jgi:hypothetical protein
MKKTILILALSILAFACVHSQLIDTPATAKPAAQLAAESIVEAINLEIKHRVDVHKVAWETLWQNTRPGATPEAILAQLGTKAALVFQFSRENLEHITRCAALVGKQPTDFIEQKYLATPRQLTFQSNGTVTLTAP